VKISYQERRLGGEKSAALTETLFFLMAAITEVGSNVKRGK
jgi:hypothetical protein